MSDQIVYHPARRQPTTLAFLRNDESDKSGR